MADDKKVKDQNSALSAWLNRKKTLKPKPGISVQEETIPSVLSYGQHRLWLLQQLYPENPFYQYSHRYRFFGPLDTTVLLQSFRFVLDRHSILRTTFLETPEGVRQVASPEAVPVVKEIDLSAVPPSEQQAKAEAIERETSRKPFTLTEGPLIRLILLKFSEDHHLLLLHIHHIIGDRWSLELINEEVAAHYRAAVKEQDFQPSPLPYQYADYARYQQQNGIADVDLEYWMQQLANPPSALPLPYDFPRSGSPSFSGMTVGRELPDHLSVQLKALSRQLQTTMFVLLLAAFKALLQRYSGERDIMVGSPFFNRDQTDLEKLVGFFNETLVLRSNVSPELGFAELVTALKKTTLDAMAHKQVPFDALVRKLRPERDGGHNPLFQVMFLYNLPVPELDFGAEIRLEEEMIDLEVAKFDLTLYVDEKPDQLFLRLEFASDLFLPVTAESILEQLEELLRGIVADPHRPIRDHALLSAEKEQQILFDWNHTAAPLPEATGIHQLIEEQVQVRPDHPAVIYGAEQLSYRELNERAEKIAAYLSARGVTPNTAVGLYCHRSVNMLSGILGILKTGAAYLPLDPDYPVDRIHFMLSDAGVPIVLCQDGLENNISGVSDIRTESMRAIIEQEVDSTANQIAVTPEDLAYIIYTSGSTGRPKGVPITHGNLIHSTSARFDLYQNDPGVFLLLSSFSFDSSVAGLFWTLCRGGTLLLPPKRIEQDIHQLAGLIHGHQVSHTLLLPSLYQLLLRHSPAKSLGSLQVVMVAGEACSPALVREHFRDLPTADLYNEYGPTEATVWCIAHKIESQDQSSVPIGKPISNTHAYILDEQLRPVPPGLAGTLYIGGHGLTRGYLNRPELTAERFIPHPFSKNEEERIYNTGDLARYTHSGTIEFLGRVDHQVKIRGHRVEPEEIAARLQGANGVSSALVTPQAIGDHSGQPIRLIAYFTGNENIESRELRNFLREQLPDYMIPAAFVHLPEFPRLPNGKINQRALPVPQPDHTGLTGAPEAPAGELEEKLAAIWQEVLQQETIGRHDNFFDIGGDSILSIRIVAKARAVDIELAPNQLFNNQTIAELARSIERADSSQFSTLVRLNKSVDNTPFFCIHSGGAHVHFYQALAQHLEGDRTLYALQPSGLDDSADHHRSIEAMAAHYLDEIRRVQTSGPYHILGTCFSNAVALEMSNQLHQAGEEEIELLIIDSGPAHLTGQAEWGEQATFRRFMDLLKQGDLHRIKRKIMNRIKPVRQSSRTWEAIAAEDQLRDLVESMNEAYARYTWSPFPGRIHFIRSSEFHSRPDKKYHLKQWRKLAGGELNVQVVPGHHLTLFKEPEVRGLARKITECLETVKV
ncbi:non-ribosomal peptide synthetase [Flavilitoribacter nigricans]|uniref:Carrier domain-containing protein n=1 Tax=Flavilitoribacter nigricans (strain ATCC 23147 / DSM 23189 / NBRC 102662 / NCIMB 1420 / SS-2) TaxID=1122177 RepID=A0A2D0NJI5_FLAN2|nr:non-ribosomal peptide synthetase [Flavilitoribacter nigricans]PHN08617.1 hypothetical protein CRP01_01510 [Flavilitoribacter nigricans DSM 23189 = NBRC 102662]